jgi:uncharacterized membrane protein
MDSEFLKEKFSSLSDSELLSIVNDHSEEYTIEALQIAKSEIEKRSLPAEVKENATQEESEISIPNNLISTVIKLIGGIEIIIALIIGFVFIFTVNITGIMIIISGIVVGFIFLGLGEIINLLHQINERQKTR